MKISGFDELNTPKVQVEEPEEYFKKMDISPKQRKERVETSKELADVMLFLFALLAIEMQANKPNYPSVLRAFRQRFRDVVNKHSRTDEYVENYINELTGGVFDTTKRYMEATGVGVDGRTDAGWWTSVDRATVIGENEANSILNYEELKQAEEEGYTTKEWVTERDNRVRPTHKEVDGVTIGINEYFIVGGGMMLAPHDEYNNPEECPNCRCSLKFGGQDTSVETESEEGNRGKFKDTIVNRNLLNARTMNSVFSVLGEDEETTAEVGNRTMEILRHRTGTRWEDLAYIDSVNHTSLINKSFNWYSRKQKKSMCQANAEMKKMVADADERTIISVHNHPSNSSPSYADIVAAYQKKYKYGLVIGHKGNIYKYSVRDDAKILGYNKVTIENRLDKLQEAIYNNDSRLKEKSIRVLAEYGVDVEVIL